MLLSLPAWGQESASDDLVEELMASLRIFHCGDPPTPIMLSHNPSGWEIIGLDRVDTVEEIDVGFRLRVSHDPDFLGYLENDDQLWTLSIFDRRELRRYKCETLDEAVAWVFSRSPRQLVQGTQALRAEARAERIEDRLDTALAELESLRSSERETELLVQIGSLQSQLAEARSVPRDIGLLQDRLLQAASRLEEANLALSVEEAISAESQRRVALLNDQVGELTTELGRLRSLLDLADERDEEAQIQIESLTQQLNTQTLRRLAAERLNLEYEERLRRIDEESQE